MIDFKNIAKLNQELAQKAQKESEESPKARGEACKTGKEKSRKNGTITLEIGGNFNFLKAMSKAEVCAFAFLAYANLLIEAGEEERLKKAIRLIETQLEEKPDE